MRLLVTTHAPIVTPLQPGVTRSPAPATGQTDRASLAHYQSRQARSPAAATSSHGPLAPAQQLIILAVLSSQCLPGPVGHVAAAPNLVPPPGDPWRDRSSSACAGTDMWARLPAARRERVPARTVRCRLPTAWQTPGRAPGGRPHRFRGNGASARAGPAAPRPFPGSAIACYARGRPLSASRQPVTSPSSSLARKELARTSDVPSNRGTGRPLP
jgi:hypothetical protein